MPASYESISNYANNNNEDIKIVLSINDTNNKVKDIIVVLSPPLPLTYAGAVVSSLGGETSTIDAHHAVGFRVDCCCTITDGAPT